MRRAILTVLASVLAGAPLAAAPRGGVDELRRAAGSGVLTRLEIAEAEYARTIRDRDAGEIGALDREVLGIIDDQVQGERPHGSAATEAAGLGTGAPSGALREIGFDAGAPRHGGGVPGRGGATVADRGANPGAGPRAPERIRERYAALAGATDAESIERKAAMIGDLRTQAQAQVPGYDTPLPKAKTVEAIAPAPGAAGGAADPTTPIRPGTAGTAGVFAR